MPKFKNLEKGDVLIDQGDKGTELYYISKGNLRVILNKSGQKKEIGILRPGEVVGEMSFLDKGTRSATVVAMNKCVVQIIDRDNYIEFLDQLPSWFTALQNTLVERLRDTNDKILP